VLTIITVWLDDEYASALMNLTIKVQKEEEDFLKPDLYTSSKFSTNESKMRKLMTIRKNSITGLQLRRSLVGGVNNFEFQKNLIEQREKEIETQQLSIMKQKQKKGKSPGTAGASSDCATPRRAVNACVIKAIEKNKEINI